MAGALARGWGEPVLCSDSGSGRARALAEELGGEAFDSNVEVAKRADLVVLCHKPYQLAAVADELRGEAKAVASVLGATTVADLQQAYPDVPVFRLMPNTAVAVRRGVVCYSPAPGIDGALESEVIGLKSNIPTVGITRRNSRKYGSAVSRKNVRIVSDHREYGGWTPAANSQLSAMYTKMIRM